jgi:hypothetical protein
MSFEQKFYCNPYRNNYFCSVVNKHTMAHHQDEGKKEINVNSLYYVVGVVFGLLTGAVLEVGVKWIIVGGILGLLTAALFVTVFVRGREQR